MVIDRNSFYFLLPGSYFCPKANETITMVLWQSRNIWSGVNVKCFAHHASVIQPSSGWAAMRIVNSENIPWERKICCCALLRWKHSFNFSVHGLILMDAPDVVFICCSWYMVSMDTDLLFLSFLCASHREFMRFAGILTERMAEAGIIIFPGCLSSIRAGQCEGDGWRSTALNHQTNPINYSRSLFLVLINSILMRILLLPHLCCSSPVVIIKDHDQRRQTVNARYIRAVSDRNVGNRKAPEKERK